MPSKNGSGLPGLAITHACGMWVRFPPRPTEYKLVRQIATQGNSEEDPNSVQQPTAMPKMNLTWHLDNSVCVR
jgi:hypothetical protein